LLKQDIIFAHRNKAKEFIFLITLSIAFSIPAWVENTTRASPYNIDMKSIVALIKDKINLKETFNPPRASL